MCLGKCAGGGGYVALLGELVRRCVCVGGGGLRRFISRDILKHHSSCDSLQLYGPEMSLSLAVCTVKNGHCKFTVTCE